MLKYLFSLFKQNKSEEVEPSEELSPEEKIRSQFKIKKKTYGDGRVIFLVDSYDYMPVRYKTLEEAREGLDEKVKSVLRDYIVSEEVVK
jgi:hypothetical protein